MSVLLCLLLWIVCIGVACWADLSAQKHISKGLEDACKCLGEAKK